MARQFNYVTVDVFTDRPFTGNPLAVVSDATGLTPDEMQAIAAEFNYSETTFVFPPEDAAHTARVRIFTRQQLLARTRARSPDTRTSGPPSWSRARATVVALPSGRRCSSRRRPVWCPWR